jgi:hypothetical protein
MEIVRFLSRAGLALFLIGSMAACAANEPASTYGPTPRTTSISARGFALEVEQVADDGATIRSVEGALEDVWNFLPIAYAAMGLELGVHDVETRVVGNPRMQLQRQLQGEPISAFLTCGAGGAMAANTYRIELSMVSTVSEPVAGRTRVRTQVEAYGRDPFAANVPVRCASTGVLERRLGTLLAQRFSTPAAPLAQRPEQMVGAEPGAEMVPDAVAAQAREVPALEHAARRQPAHPALLALGGVAGSVVGAYLGDRLSRSVYDCDQHQRDRHPLYPERQGPMPPGCLETAMSLIGPAAGTTLLVPLGVHLANGRKGQYIPNLVVSSGWVLAGVLAAGLTDEPRILWVLPLPQLVSGVLVERATTRRPRGGQAHARDPRQ